MFFVTDDFHYMSSQNQLNVNIFRKDVTNHDIKAAVFRSGGSTVDVTELQQ